MIFPESKKIQVIIKNNQIIREKDNKRLRKIWIDNKRETKQLISSFSSRPSRAAAIAATSSSSSSSRKRLIIYLNDDEYALIMQSLVTRKTSGLVFIQKIQPLLNKLQDQRTKAVNIKKEESESLNE